MDTKGHIGQVIYHMARLGYEDTEQFDISGMQKHLRALGADQELIDYVAENGRDGGFEDGWMLRRHTHRQRIEAFLDTKRQRRIVIEQDNYECERIEGDGPDQCVTAIAYCELRGYFYPNGKAGYTDKPYMEIVHVGDAHGEESGTVAEWGEEWGDKVDTEDRALKLYMQWVDGDGFTEHVEDMWEQQREGRICG